jgi:hypothetical protein
MVEQLACSKLLKVDYINKYTEEVANYHKVIREGQRRADFWRLLANGGLWTSKTGNNKGAVQTLCSEAEHLYSPGRD